MTNRMSYIEARQALAPPKKHKYRAKRVSIEGKSFPSLAEGQAYADLLVLERLGKVNAVRCQHRLDLHVVGPDGIKRKIGSHAIDFSYWDCEQKKRRWLEVKGYRHRDGEWRRTHASFEYGIVIEVRHA